MKKLFLLSLFAVTFSYAQVTDENGLSAKSLQTPLSGNIGIGVTPSSSSPYILEVNGSTLFKDTMTLGNPSGTRTVFQTNSNHKIYAPTNIKTIDLDGNWKGGGFIGVYRDDIHNSEGAVNMHAHLDSKSYKLNIDEFRMDGADAKGAALLISTLQDGDSQALTGLQLNTTNSVVVIGDLISYEKNKGYGLVNRFKSKFENDIFVETGNLGIGTNSFVDGTETFRLSVEGKIRAHAVKVYTDWADFVFEPNYELQTLEEVERYINKNGHLKNIPSAEEVEVNGIELGEMNKLLLQKIEELTLYVIELKKEVEMLKVKE